MVEELSLLGSTYKDLKQRVSSVLPTPAGR